jgi:hypothetical protein
LTPKETVIFETQKELLNLADRLQVETIINELNIYTNPADLLKKNDFIEYICA